VFLVAVTVVAVVVAYPGALLDLGDEATRNSELSFADREIAGGNGVVVDQTVVYAARALIPVGETYHVAIGPDFSGGTDLTSQYVDSYYRYFLMPRRPAEDAQWIVCYGCDVDAYGEHTAVRWSNGSGISILRRPDEDVE
jgi:hypothetical protein